MGKFEELILLCNRVNSNNDENIRFELSKFLKRWFAIWEYRGLDTEPYKKLSGLTFKTAKEYLESYLQKKEA